jgi:hypothetical protein
VAGQYVPSTDIDAAVMKMLADTRGISGGHAAAGHTCQAQRTISITSTP